MGKRRTREDWIVAALAMIAERGVAALAVEPLAQRVGATKGSAYWHFPSREALLTAALRRWSEQGTAWVIEATSQKGDPAEQLWLMFERVMINEPSTAIEYAIMSAAGDPVVAPMFHEATRQRVDYLSGLFEGIGFEPEAARWRGRHLYGFFLGHIQLVSNDPSAVPSGDRRREYVEAAYRMMTAR
ncbi:hypothetical protein KALB_7100 [Kutzneria albida DSM 43870]|uniref:HTH tetR-type domain-containing protein n=1 Tax=Kutzneria albida DSM 43870 TaxID=1449976 RepID=W5WHW2_9PSEU|nr:hypothetical protein KALB_7100 [Kutzneria albida DSM 43870]